MPEGAWDSTTGRHETLDDWLDQWFNEGGWQATKPEVQRLVDEIGRLRRWQADADTLISHAEETFDYDGREWCSYEDITNKHFVADPAERKRLREVWDNAVLRGNHARGLTSPETLEDSPQSASEPPEAQPVPETGEGEAGNGS
jgi:hypothetical protein